MIKAISNSTQIHPYVLTLEARGPNTAAHSASGERTHPQAGKKDLSLGLQKPKDGKRLQLCTHPYA